MTITPGFIAGFGLLSLMFVFLVLSTREQSSMLESVMAWSGLFSTLGLFLYFIRVW